MEFVTRLFRALAHRDRIRLVRVLCVLGEQRTTGLAEALGLPLSPVSTHLAVLASADVVWRRRSGKAVYYEMAQTAGNMVTQRVLAALRHTFSELDATSARQVAASQAPPPLSDEALFNCFTAFTHPRRLQMIRLLLTRESFSLDELAGELSMSVRACLRHVSKLARRGYLTRKSVGRHSRYALARGATAFHQTILSALQDWFEESSRKRRS